MQRDLNFGGVHFSKIFLRRRGWSAFVLRVQIYHSLEQQRLQAMCVREGVEGIEVFACSRVTPTTCSSNINVLHPQHVPERLTQEISPRSQIFVSKSIINGNSLMPVVPSTIFWGLRGSHLVHTTLIFRFRGHQCDLTLKGR